MNLSVRRFDFNSGVSSVARPSMLPAPDGEYCLYAEVCAVLQKALDTLSEAQPSPQGFFPVVICGHIIPLDKNGLATTYCMKKLGHEGECV